MDQINIPAAQTLRTTRLQQDESMAKEFQDEEDERIARKLQNDFDMGIDPGNWKLYQSRPQTMAKNKNYHPNDNHVNLNEDLLRQDIDDFTRLPAGRQVYSTSRNKDDDSDSEGEKLDDSPIIQSRSYDGASTPQSDDFYGLPGTKKTSPRNLPNSSTAMQQLSAYVSSYHPETIDLETILKPFIPEYIAAIPDPDPMLKIPMPKSKDEIVQPTPLLGLSVLDEPHIKQSDTAALSLQLRALQKSSHESDLTTAIKSIDVPITTSSGKKLLHSWVTSVNQMHVKPSEIVTYSKRMPDIEELMQRYPSRFLDLLLKKETTHLADLDIDLTELSQLCLALMDIPVHPNNKSQQRVKTRQLIESLHVLFSLYLEFDEHGHFGRL